MKKLIYLFIFSIIVSCSNNNSNPVSPIADTLSSAGLQNDTIASDDNSLHKKDTLTVNLGEITIGFIDLEIFPNTDKSGIDTTVLYLELGEGVDSQLVFIDHSGIKDFSITERFQTTVSVMNEGPHIELYDWKSYRSPLTQLQRVSTSLYRMQSIPKEESEKFPEFTKEELIDYVNKNAGESWGNLIKNPLAGTTWKDQFWIGVGIRTIRVSGILPSGEAITKTILIYPAIGC